MSGDGDNEDDDELSELPKFSEDFLREFREGLDQVLDETYGPAPVRTRPPTPSHWPKLSARVGDKALLHKLNPERALEKIGRFEGLATIGEGGFGTVFRVRDPELDRLAALKLCRTLREGTEEALLHEARALAKVKHPNIITVYEIGHYRGAVFLVTEYVKAVDMHDYAVDFPLRWDAVLDLFIPVGEAVAAAHNAGVVHGDIKPANIIVEWETKTPYLVDFGLARIMDRSPEELEAEVGGLGTLQFMAPELRRGGVRDELSDQYAFCVSLWQSLEGYLPFIDDDRDELLGEGAESEFLRMRRDVPDRVRAVVRRGLSAEREQRYADMGALVEALRFARGPVLVLEPEPQVEPEPQDDVVAVSPTESSQPDKKKPHLGLLAAFLIGAALASTAGSMLFWMSPGESPSQSASTLRVSPVTDALRGFAAAHLAVVDGDLERCKSEWRRAHESLLAHDTKRAAELSLWLGEAMTKNEWFSQAAYVAGFAADDFETVAAWKQAAGARARAATWYEAAGELESMDKQESCRIDNDAGHVCQGID